MTKIDFYVLQPGATGDRFQLACRVAEKALSAGHRVVIHAPQDDQARHLDRLLWTLKEESFIAHGLIGTGEPELNPILIGDASQAHEEHDVLVNLAPDLPVFFSRFKRLAECVDNDDAARVASRDRYRWYRERGYPLDLHQLK